MRARVSECVRGREGGKEGGGDRYARGAERAERLDCCVNYCTDSVS